MAGNQASAAKFDTWQPSEGDGLKPRAACDDRFRRDPRHRGRRVEMQTHRRRHEIRRDGPQRGDDNERSQSG